MRTYYLKLKLHNAICKLMFFFAGLYFVTFALVLPLTCREWAYSAYFQKPNNLTDFIRRATQLNNVAKTKAQHYLENLDAKEIKTTYKRLLKSESLELVIAVITIDRESSEDPQYLTQTLAKLDAIIKTGYHKLNFNTSVFICDANAEKKFRKEVHAMERYFVARHSRKHKHPLNRFEKEKQDYVFCIEQALKTRSTYVLMLEDDALPKDDMLRVLNHLLTIHKKSVEVDRQELHYPYEVKIANSNWAFLKLFYPPAWRGFGWELRHLVDLLSISIIGGMGFLITSQLISKWKTKHLFNKSQELLIFLTGTLYFALFVFAIGKPYIMEVLGKSKHLYRISYAPECCTPAVLLTREKANEIVQYLKTQTCNSKYALDLALDSFVKSRNYVGLLLEPNLVTHIGMVSSLKTGMKFPQDYIFR